MAKNTLSVAPSGGLPYNLTTLGSTDWLTYDGNAMTPLRKSGGSAIGISQITGSGALVPYSRPTSPILSFTDGINPVSASEQGGLYIVNAGGFGWIFTAPADTTARRLRIYAGIYAGTAMKVTTTLSDSSASPATDASVVYVSGPDPFTAEYVIDYSAASAGQTLTARVEAIGSTAALSIQGAALGTPPAITAPGAPIIGTATAGNASLSISFSAPSSDGGSAVTGYTATAYNSGTNAPITSASGTSSPITISGLTNNGPSVYVKVAATNTAGTGAQSAASNTVTPNNINNPPVFAGTIPGIGGQAGVAIGATDVHGYFSDTDTLVYSASPAGTAWPSGLTINSSTGVITGTVATAGNTVGLKVRATDTASQATDSNAFNVAMSSGPQQVAHTDSAILFSPYGWDDRGTAKSANTPGAYAKMSFTGTSVTAKFDVSLLSGASTPAGSYPIVRMVVDGKYVTDVQLGSSAPNAAVSGLSAGSHTIEMYFRAIDVNLSDRWGTSAGAQPVSALRFTGFMLDAGASYASVSARPKRMGWWGDSITEGYFVNAAANPTGNNAQGTSLPFIAQALGCEYGQLGYSAQGYEKTGNGGVPAVYDGTPANSMVNFYSNGRSRLVGGVLSPAPDYLCIMHGANGSTSSASVGGVIDRLRTIAPGAQIFVLVPAGGYARAAITAAVAARNADTKLALIDLGTDYQPGLDSSGNGGQYSNDNGLHPNLLGNAKAATGYLPKMQTAIDGAAQVPTAPATTARTFAVQLYTGPGVPAANLTGLKIRCFNADNTLAYSTDSGGSDANGAITVSAQSTSASGAVCLMVVRSADHHWANFVVVS